MRISRLLAFAAASWFVFFNLLTVGVAWVWIGVAGIVLVLVGFLALAAR